ncbi:MAG: C40 family peptidase [Muribaculaceae bacterium]|nr:C40 family peptidase [Muribaculaceae bacterium]
MKRVRHTLAVIAMISVLILWLPSCKSHKEVNTDEIYTTESTDDKYGDLPIKDKRLREEVKAWMGTPYKYGGHSKNGTDCSGFVMEVFKAVYDIKLERNSAKIYENNCKKIKKNDLREGDLVFFITGSKNRISHVGIYLNDGDFVHASSSKGVTINNLTQRYYTNHYAGSGRVK